MPATELELYHSTSTLKFFIAGLEQEIARLELEVEDEELLYVSTIPSHFVDCKVDQTLFMGLPKPYQEVVKDVLTCEDQATLEHAGAELLLWSGFFGANRACQKYRQWYYQLGGEIFWRSSQLAYFKKRKILRQVSEHFRFWSKRFQDLNRTLRDEPYVLDLPMKEDGSLIIN